VLLIELLAGADGPETEGDEVAPGVKLLYDGEGRVIGIEITNAKKHIISSALDKLTAAGS
jgi:uncharacterized protein YuzE